MVLESLDGCKKGLGQIDEGKGHHTWEVMMEPAGFRSSLPQATCEQWEPNAGIFLSCVLHEASIQLGSSDVATSCSQSVRRVAASALSAHGWIPVSGPAGTCQAL